MRTSSSIRNTSIALLSQIGILLLSFVGRTVFIQQLGVNYLGISGLFSNILSLLSLAELGIGSAITFALYKPLAEFDKDKTKALIALFSTAYKIIGCVVIILGLSLMPFLDYLIKDKPNIPHLEIIYLLFLANSVSTYFFAAKRTLIIADQKEYINTLNQLVFSTFAIIMQITALILTQNYILYLLISIFFTLLSNIFISFKVNKLYPYLTNGETIHLSKEERKRIFKYVRAAMSHKVGDVVVNGTDNLLLSSFVGVYWVGLYSNYLLLLGTVQVMIGQFFNSVLASVGNLNATASKEKSYEVYKALHFICFWLYGWSSICLLLLFNPFITLWIGDQFLLDKNIVFIIVVNFLLCGMRQCNITYKNSLGLFWNDRYKPLFESAINLIASVLLLQWLGFLGILLGTLISTLTTSFWVEPYILFKHGFDKPLYAYFKTYVVYLGIIILAAGLTYLSCTLFSTATAFSFIGKMVCCLVIPNLVFFLLCRKTSEYQYLSGIAKAVLNKYLVKA